MNLVILTISIGRCPTALRVLFDMHTLIKKHRRGCFPHGDIQVFFLPRVCSSLVYVKYSYCHAENYAFLQHIYEIASDKCCFPGTFLILLEFYFACEF